MDSAGRDVNVTQPTAVFSESRNPPSESRIEIDQRDEYQGLYFVRKQKRSEKQPPVVPVVWLEKKRAYTSFTQRIEDLLAYKEMHGHTFVKKSEDKSLYEFCNNMRHTRRNLEKSSCIMNDDRIASLDALGFGWFPTQLVRVNSGQVQPSERIVVQPSEPTPKNERIQLIVDKYRSIFESMNEKKRTLLEELDSSYDRVLHKPKSGFDLVVIRCIANGIELCEMNWYLRLHGEYNLLPLIGNTSDDLLIKRLKSTEHRNPFESRAE